MGIAELKRAAIEKLGTPEESVAAVALVRALKDAEPKEGEIPERVKRMTMPFGKHKGKTLSSLVNTDRDYLEWAVENFTAAKPELMDAMRLILNSTPGSVDDDIVV